MTPYRSSSRRGIVLLRRKLRRTLCIALAIAFATAGPWHGAKIGPGREGKAGHAVPRLAGRLEIAAAVPAR